MTENVQDVEKAAAVKQRQLAKAHVGFSLLAMLFTLVIAPVFPTFAVLVAFAVGTQFDSVLLNARLLKEHYGWDVVGYLNWTS